MGHAAREIGLRWLKFNAVGALGIVVQVGALAALVALARMNYLVATGLAVEAAVLHNFVWHERYTWRDRTGGGAGGGTWRRLVKFHLTNGILSVGGNLVLMHVLVGRLRMNYLLGNLATIAICSLGNFAASHWFVFGAEQRARTGARARDTR
jgi:putative flippase GtrA